MQKREFVFCAAIHGQIAGAVRRTMIFHPL